jgi:hypothetical protein
MEFPTKRYDAKLMQKLFKKIEKVLELNGARIEPEYFKKKKGLNINGKYQKICQVKELYIMIKI